MAGHCRHGIYGFVLDEVPAQGQRGLVDSWLQLTSNGAFCNANDWFSGWGSVPA